MTTTAWNPASPKDPCGAGLPCGSTLESLKDHPEWFPGSISIIGKELLRRVIALYDCFHDPNDPDFVLPGRRIWTVGEVPYDCNQLIVSLDSLAEGLVNTENQPPNPCHVPVNATFNITVVRCYPVDPKGNATAPDVLAKAADLAAKDAYLLLKLSGCLDMYGADTGGAGGFGGMGTEASISISNAQGGVQAVTLELTTVVG